MVSVSLYRGPVGRLEPGGKLRESYLWRCTYYGMEVSIASTPGGSQRVSPEDLDSVGNKIGDWVGSALRCGSAAGGDAESSRAGSGVDKRRGGTKFAGP